jgi:hypothetical protein
VVQAGTSLAEVEVEPLVLPTGVGAEVGGEPTATVDADASEGARWIGGAMVVHRPVLRRSTTGWSGHNLPLLGFLVGADCIIHDHHITDELWKRPSSVERHALL